MTILLFLPTLPRNTNTDRGVKSAKRLLKMAKIGYNIAYENAGSHKLYLKVGKSSPKEVGFET